MRYFHIYSRPARRGEGTGPDSRVVQVRAGRVYGRGAVLAEGSEAGSGDVSDMLILGLGSDLDGARQWGSTHPETGEPLEQEV